MKLKFYAKDDELVYVPNAPKRQGQPPRYVGRSLVPGDPDKATMASFPASAEPFECDSDDANGQELLGRFRRGKRPLWPADKATAEACGVEFVAITIKDGVSVASERQAQPETKPARASARSEAE
ncbi:MAG TPA: hypothetical protein VFR23_24715 [Jiangellaceae bacterium]|nr:hypothetical protein [Jiangellaceae bacterium]